MTQVMEKRQPWLAALEARPQGGPRWLQDLRDHGAARFSALGFPTVRDEDWRFTNISPIANAEFAPANGDAPRLNEEAVPVLLYGVAPYRIVIVNGRFAPELSHIRGLGHGVQAGSLATAVTEQADVTALPGAARRVRDEGVYRAQYGAGLRWRLRPYSGRRRP